MQNAVPAEVAGTALECEPTDGVAPVGKGMRLERKAALESIYNA